MGNGETEGEVYVEPEVEFDFVDDEWLLELFLRELVFGRIITNCGWREVLVGMRVMVGPLTRCREVERFFFSLLSKLDAALLFDEQSMCFELPHLGHEDFMLCIWSCDWVKR